MNIDSGSAEAQARDRLAEIGFAEVERRLAAAREDVARRQFDPFDKARKIRGGELDGELPQYEEMTGWFQRAPITWLPGLLATVAQHCALRHVFKEGRLLSFVEKAVERAAPGGELRDDSARAGGGKEPIRASGDCICSMCGKRYGDHPMDKEVLSGIDNLPFLHVLCDGARVKL